LLYLIPAIQDFVCLQNYIFIFILPNIDFFVTSSSTILAGFDVSGLNNSIISIQPMQSTNSVRVGKC